MCLNTALKNRLIKLVQYVFSLIASPLYVFLVFCRVFKGKLAFLQPLVVGTMPLALQLIFVDIIFSAIMSKGRGDRTLSAILFIAALNLCQFLVRAGWIVYESVLISAVAVISAPRGRWHFILRWSILLLFLGLGLS